MIRKQYLQIDNYLIMKAIMFINHKSSINHNGINFLNEFIFELILIKLFNLINFMSFYLFIINLH